MVWDSVIYACCELLRGLRPARPCIVPVTPTLTKRVREKAKPKKTVWRQNFSSTRWIFVRWTLVHEGGGGSWGVGKWWRGGEKAKWLKTRTRIAFILFFFFFRRISFGSRSFFSMLFYSRAHWLYGEQHKREKEHQYHFLFSHCNAIHYKTSPSTYHIREYTIYLTCAFPALSALDRRKSEWG